MEFLKKAILVLLLGMGINSHALETPAELKGKTVTYLMGYAPGGTHDTVARKLVQAMGKLTDVNFVVMNKPGASTSIAANDVLKNDPNGLVIFHSGTELMLNHLDKMPTAPRPDSFLPVITIMEFHMSPIVKKGVANSVNDLVELSKVGKGISYSTGSSLTTLVTEYFLENIRAREALPVPYKTASQMMMAVISNEVTFMLASNWESVVDSNQATILAISGDRRSAYPNVPTLKDLGINIDLTEYVGIFVHNDTPPHLADFYNKLISLALKDPEVIKAVQGRNGKVIGGNLQKTQENYQRYISLRENMHKKYKHRLGQ